MSPFFLLFTLFFSHGLSNHLPGGVSNVLVTDEGVVAAGQYSFTNLYHSETPATFHIVSATQQVVAGIKYELVLAITPEKSSCFLLDVVIVNRFGEFIILTHNKVEGKC